MATTQQSKTTIYLNQRKDAGVPRVEIAPSRSGGHYVAIYARSSAKLAPLQQKLEDETILSVMTHQGHAVMMLHSDKPEQLLDKLQLNTKGSLIKEVDKKKWWQKLDLIHVRGWVGNIGQAFMIASGFLDRDNKGKFNWSEPNGRAKIMSASISFIGNSVNARYGVQKKTDKLREKFVNHRINKMLVESAGVDESKLASVETVLTANEAKEQPSWMDQNSLKFSNGIKLIGKIALASAPRKDLYMAGWLSIISKLVTLSGKDEDPFKLEKDQSLLTRLRRHSNLIAGPLEWIANITLFMGSMLEPRDKTKKPPKASLFRLPKMDDLKLFDLKENKFRSFGDVQWFQFLGALTIFGSLTAKSLAPFTSKKIDVNEFTAHTAHGLAQVEPEKREQLLGDTVVKIMEMKELPEMHALGFAGTFAKIADDLEFRQGIAIRSNGGNKQNGQMADNRNPEELTERYDAKAHNTHSHPTKPTQDKQPMKEEIATSTETADTVHQLAQKAIKRSYADSTLPQKDRVEKLASKGNQTLKHILDHSPKEGEALMSLA